MRVETREVLLAEIARLEKRHEVLMSRLESTYGELLVDVNKEISEKLAMPSPDFVVIQELAKKGDLLRDKWLRRQKTFTKDLKERFSIEERISHIKEDIGWADVVQSIRNRNNE
jgi:hypothetical protein